MNFDESEVYSAKEQFINHDTIVKDLMLGFTEEGKKLKASLFLHVPYDSDFELAHDQLRLISWFYYNYFVFQHIADILVSKNLSNLHILKTKSLHEKAIANSLKFLELIKKLIKKNKLKFDVKYFYENKGKKEYINENAKDLLVIQSFSFEIYNGNGLGYMEVFEGAYFTKTSPIYNSEEMKYTELEYVSTFGEVSIILAYFEFFNKTLLNLSVANTLVSDEELLDLLEKAIKVCIDYKAHLVEKEKKSLNMFPVKFERSYIDKQNWRLLHY